MKLYSWNCGLVLALCLAWPAEAAVLIPLNATWKYHKGTSEASSPDTTAWRQVGFNDSGWSSGAMPFFYGENLSGGTVLSDMRYNYSTVYLRREFVVSDPEAVGSLDLNSMSDDGFIAWINGYLVRLYNVNTPNKAYNGFADVNAQEPVQLINYRLPDPSNYLVEGVNVIAIQALNVNLSSSDLVVNMQLVSAEPDFDPPVILSVDPPPGTVGGLSEITVRFSEPVFGVNREDLLLNGTTANAVIAADDTFTFQFDPQAPGSFEVTWADGHGIVDLAEPPNAFDATAEGATWAYSLEDQVAPWVESVHPISGRTLRQFSAVEVRFAEPVTGVDAGDLLANGEPAVSVSGLAAGPYLFEFEPVTSGPVSIQWASGHQIADLASNGLVTSTWSYTVNAGFEVGDLVINEIVSANQSGLVDEDGDTEDWIEIWNRGTSTVNLLGWSLTDDAGQPGQWVFPARSLAPGQYLVVFASGKDRKPTQASARLHTNFKLSSAGEYLGLFSPELPRAIISELAPEFPEQRNDYSYGRISDGTWRYFSSPTPGGPNGSSAIEGVTDPVHFSAVRGFYNVPFNLLMSCETPGAVIRYTLDGSEPTAQGGTEYTGLILINRTEFVRAAAFAENRLPSRVGSHSYFYNLSTARKSLPVVSLLTRSNNLWGSTGIMETNPRNTTQRGLAWERPVSVEWIEAADNEGFQIDAGLRIQGGNYVRQRYDPNGSLPFSKYSFRLYFRGDYGASKLEYPVMPGSAVDVFDKLVLRAGMNDHSNPFVVDELVRRLVSDMGHVSSRGTFVTLFLNGEHQGYYNPTERIDADFLRSWHGGTNEWDLIAQFGEVREGDTVEWNVMRNAIVGRDMSQASNYAEADRRLDLVNFVDYLLVNIYAGTGDWPHNNWRAARERVPGAKFRFYVWDAEWAFGNQGRSVNVNTLTEELARDADIAHFYQALRLSPEFRLLFADRIQKHLFNEGALTDDHITSRFLDLRFAMAGVLPRMNTTILGIWIPQRRAIIMQHLQSAGLLMAVAAPVLDPHGGRVPAGQTVSLSTPQGQGDIYYTTNGVDPRVRFSGSVAPDAVRYTNGAPLNLDRGMVLKARALNGGNWSALSEAAFQVGGPGVPLRITEIMYNPVGGSAYEFIELKNVGDTALDLSLARFEGIQFEFWENTMLAPGAFLVLASDENPAAFASRYPGVAVAGYFGGNLSNGGERIAVIDARGVTMTSVTYDDENGWPLEADGKGPSLEIVDPFGDPNDPLNWHARAGEWGSPGYSVLSAPLPEGPRLSEMMADNRGSVPHAGTFPDWIELHNPTGSDIDLEGWSLSDDGNNPTRFVFPAGAILPADDYLVVWCDSEFGAPGLHTGFGLGRLGETVWLHDPDGQRVDAMTFGMQIPDYSIGVLEPGSGEWILTDPTPGAANVAAVIGSQESVALNEWLANPMPGAAQWIELFNRNPDLPVALKGLAFAVNGGVSQLNRLSFLAPGGFAVLYPDGNTGANRLDLQLASTSGTLSLLNEAGTELDQVNYTTQAAGVSQGRFPDGDAEIIAFPGTASPESSNYIPSQDGPILNEFMARNVAGVPNSEGRMADWVELVNPTEAAFDLGGMRLSLNPGNPAQWVFPEGSSLGAGEHLVVWFDGSSEATTTVTPEPNTGRSLPGQSGGIYFYDADGRLMDRVEYGPQLRDHSVGRSGGEWRMMSQPTPGAVNASSEELGLPGQLRINEWMARPASGEDWFEIFNRSDLPVSLGGLYLTDDPSTVGQTQHKIAPLSFIAPRGFVRFEADGSVESGANHVGFSLNRAGETLRLNLSTQGVLDSVTFGPQEEGVSEGRLPDGDATMVSFVTSPTPGLPNYLPLTRVVINEVIAHTDPPLEDAIELKNIDSTTVDLSGWFLSDSPDDLQKYRIPDGTVLSAGDFAVFYEEQLNGGDGSRVPFSLGSERGETVWLSEADGGGDLTGYRIPVTFGASANGVALGRFQTSIGVDFVALESPTFGVENPATLEEFRSGQGAPNAYPRVGPVVFSEIHYHPEPEPSEAEGYGGEYLELHNITDSSVPLYDPAAPANTWRVAVGVNYVFPEGVTLDAGERMLLVDFDPVASPATLAAFQAMYDVPGDARIMGPFAGRLDNAGERIELLMSDLPTTSGPDAGFVPYVLVEAVEYGREGLWPVEADGTGRSLQRLEAAAYGNEPLNWLAAMPTAGLPNADAPSPLDSDGDGMPDDWEIANGFDPEYAGDANEDFDGDGISNVDEFRSGTDPRDPLSRLHLTVTLDESGDAWIEFPAAAQRSYSILRRDSLEAGGWERLLDVEAEASPRTVTVHDDDGDPGASRFYRIRTPALP